jgi:hypothetical protein
MTDLDLLLRELAPVLDDEVAALDLRRAERELVREITAARRDRRPARLVLAGALAAACAVVIALVVAGGGTRPRYADAAIRVADANARLLVGEPGWKLTEADEFAVDEGEVTFTNGNGRFEVHWRPAAQYRSYLHDRTLHAEQANVTVLGRPAKQFTYRALRLDDVATLLPPQGGHFTELRGSHISVARYMQVLRSLETVDVNTWLAAMPAVIVTPGGRPAVVDRWLKGVPIPPGVDVAALRSGRVHSEIQVAGEVYGPIACGWLDQWTAARRRGDRAAEREALTAMADTREWPGLRELSRSGWSNEIWNVAAEMRSGAVSDEHRATLGCDQ